MNSHELNVFQHASLIHTESAGVLSHTVALTYQNSLGDSADSALKLELDKLLEQARVKLQSHIDNAVAKQIFDEVWKVVVEIADGVFWAIENFLKSIGINI